MLAERIAEILDAGATRAVQTAGLTNVEFAVRDVGQFDERARYDLITSLDAVHDPMNVWFVSCRS